MSELLQDCRHLFIFLSSTRTAVDSILGLEQLPNNAMKLNLKNRAVMIGVVAAASYLTFRVPASALQVTYAPYLQPGDNGSFEAQDQIVVAWQTDETTPNASAYRIDYGLTSTYGSSSLPSGRIVDNYLAADKNLPAGSNPYGAHIDYSVVLSSLAYDTTYYYRVTGPGLPNNGFAAQFHTRKRSGQFSFIVEGDEGSFPANPNTNPATLVNYEARINHLMYNAAGIALPGQPARPAADFYLNTGDNVYTTGSEDTYRDFFFPVFNNDVDSNETGAPIVRNFLYYITVGNHDVGSTGVTANLLSDNSAPRFSGNTGGGDALAYFNSFYYPLNGAQGYDIQNTWNVDTATPNGLVFTYQNQTYTSPAAIDAFRASTVVDSGHGPKQQFELMNNYSFDNGSGHFLFLDANPHLFDGMLDTSASTTAPPAPFPEYPAGLRNWIINDLDSSKQPWKVVVFHQPSFSSGDATIFNHQMRAVAKILEDHGVNIVFNGHEHNYQRTYPLRANDRVAGALNTTSGPAVDIDTHYDGATQTVPDGVLYIVEGAGGNRDFDGNFAPPRGSGLGVDQDDSATGAATPAPGVTIQQGPADWLDTNLTNLEMAQYYPNAGSGPKITVKFKSKVFSFGHLVVNNNNMTLWQISEPLQSTSSASSAVPAPYGTDVNGAPLNDPIPDTLLNATTGQLISSPATGTPALLDRFTITKPDVSASLVAQLSAPPNAALNGAVVYSVTLQNKSSYGLNGTQVRVTLPSNLVYADTLANATVQGSDVVMTIGRLASGQQQLMQMKTRVVSGVPAGTKLTASATVSSGTALPVTSNAVTTTVVQAPGLPALSRLF